MPSPSAPTRRSLKFGGRVKRRRTVPVPALRSHCAGVSQQQQPPIYCVTHAHTTRSTTKPRVVLSGRAGAQALRASLPRAPELGEDCIDRAKCLAVRAPNHSLSSIASRTPLRACSECVPPLGRAGGVSLGRAAGVPQRHPRRPLARRNAFDRVRSALRKGVRVRRFHGRATG